jgi:hypothetical protein
MPLRLHFLSHVKAEGGANVYGAFGRVCSIFPVLLFRRFPSNVPPRARFINVGSSKFEPAAGPLTLFFGVSFLGFCIVTDA